MAHASRLGQKSVLIIACYVCNQHHGCRGACKPPGPIGPGIYLAIVNTDFHSSSFFILCLKLFTHFGGTRKYDILWALELDGICTQKYFKILQGLRVAQAAVTERWP